MSKKILVVAAAVAALVLSAGVAQADVTCGPGTCVTTVHGHGHHADKKAEKHEKKAQRHEH